VAAIREGMSLIIPVPLLSLCSGKLLETYVCGAEYLDVAVLKKIVRLVDGLINIFSVFKQPHVVVCDFYSFLGIVIFLLIMN